MHVPPVIPAKPSEAATAPSTSTGSGDEDFASMIPTVQENSDPVEVIDTSEPEVPSDLAGANQPEHADRQMVQVPVDVIQSLLAESKLHSEGPSLLGPELQLIGDIEATMAVQPPTGATPDDGAIKGVVTGVQPVAAGISTEPAQPNMPEVAIPENPTPDRHGQVPLADLSADVAAPAQDQPAKGPPPTQQAMGGPIDAASAVRNTAGASPGSNSVEGIDAGALNGGQPSPLPVSPVPLQTIGLTDLAPGKNDLKPQGAKPGQIGANKQVSAANPAPGTNTGAATVPTQDPSAMANVTATNPNTAGSEAPLDGSSQTAITASDSAAAKAAPPAPGAGANSAVSQSGVTTDMAAAFGSDLRLGADGVRPAAVEQAFRGQPLQPASEQVAVQISRAVQQGADRITVNLKPASLGLISVDLEVGPDNRLIAVVSVDRPETLDLMQRDARALERALNDAGLKTDSGSLSFNLRGEGGNEHAEGDDASDWSSYAAPADTNDATPTPIYARTLSADGGIDIRV